VNSGTAKTRWPIVTIRIFAILSVLFGGLGMVLLVESLFRFFLRNRTLDPGTYYPEVFLTKVVINFLCIVMLLAAALFLWKLERRGLRLSNLVFCLEIVYFAVVDSWFGLWLVMSANERAQAIGHAMGATGGTGNMGVAPQIITGFPVLALIFINLAYSRLRGKELPAPVATLTN
jgi:hypothetical protein